ncbi:YggS family pyridoxal phosphate-dependent enzyme [Aureivirga sp. CE67]|uniref:YggS family pyridoxal phosphate-dependent enzyme n=1 Tax=Aureivirga sp. CE67 TaxID=1788983 RepID=UPI0018CA4053|nr:YggS family pyridoxal phosphate-dependent enzyme [Aureivirga sp. CE67]
MSNIKENLEEIKKTIPENVTLVAVSKTKPNEDILEAYEAGQRVFGENKVQEMVEKHEALPKDISWHLIGHLQKNKVKYMASFVDLIHGVDSLKTLVEIDKQAKRYRRNISCLLQIKIAKEDTKFGFAFEDVKEILKSETFRNLENITIKGLMGMATFTENEETIREEFSTLKKNFDELKVSYPEMETISMGMSGDYQVAIEEGSSMVRVGSAIFGKRNYN